MRRKAAVRSSPFEPLSELCRVAALRNLTETFAGFLARFLRGERPKLAQSDSATDVIAVSILNDKRLHAAGLNS